MVLPQTCSLAVVAVHSFDGGNATLNTGIATFSAPLKSLPCATHAQGRVDVRAVASSTPVAIRKRGGFFGQARGLDEIEVEGAGASEGLR